MTVYYEPSSIGPGNVVMVARTYTQTFSEDGAAAEVTPSVAKGSVGLGTLTGEVGVVKTGLARVKVSDGAAGGRGKMLSAGAVGGWGGLLVGLVGVGVGGLLVV